MSRGSDSSLPALSLPAQLLAVADQVAPERRRRRAVPDLFRNSVSLSWCDAEALDTRALASTLLAAGLWQLAAGGAARLEPPHGGYGGRLLRARRQEQTPIRVNVPAQPGGRSLPGALLDQLLELGGASTIGKLANSYLGRHSMSDPCRALIEAVAQELVEAKPTGAVENTESPAHPHRSHPRALDRPPRSLVAAATGPKPPPRPTEQLDRSAIEALGGALADAPASWHNARASDAELIDALEATAARSLKRAEVPGDDSGGGG